jgi:hypothetical protein
MEFVEHYNGRTPDEMAVYDRPQFQLTHKGRFVDVKRKSRSHIRIRYPLESQLRMAGD